MYVMDLSFYYCFSVLCALLLITPFSVFLFAFSQELLESSPFDDAKQNITNKDSCALFYYLVSNSPCMFTLYSGNYTINVPINFELIENDDNDSIKHVTNYGNLNDNLTSLILSKNELFSMIKIGGNLPFDIFSLKIYMIPHDTENGKIIGIDNKSFNKIFLQPYEKSNGVYFNIPSIFSYSEWKIVIEYEINDEVEGFYISPNFKID